ncbi:MAG: 50S ribosomal protein L24 [Bacteriovoracaceae bacterium]|mgnify:CR=1 FL=1|jgi:large subunit ribosomal protein L24|nr:50S ribosomal protein L24 [Bacteriovoracaceae bacterium]
MQKLRLNDEVVVLAGKEKGKTAKVTNINWKRRIVFLEGLNTSTKAMKPTQENPSGGFAQVEAGVHISNVAVVSPKTNKATRVRIENRDGKKVRVATACGSVLS